MSSVQSLNGRQRLDLAHQAIMVQDLAEMAKMNRRLAADSMSNRQSEINPGDDMGDIILGDVVHTTTTTSQAPQANTPAQSNGSGLMKGLLGAGLIASGIGMPVGIGLVAQSLPHIINALKPPAATAPSQPGTNHSTTESVSVDMLVDPPSSQ